MKKKTRTMTMILALTSICFVAIATKFPVFAEETRSRGNFVLENGEMALYASDTDYLQDNIESLYSELPGLPSSDMVAYSMNRKDNIRSKGILDYASGTVVIDSSDLIYLSDEIDLLESAYKINTANALNKIGTYFLEDGSVTHNPDIAGSGAMLPFDSLYNGILMSQSVAHLANEQAVNAAGEALYYASEAAKNDNSLVMPTTTDNGFPLLIQAPSPENVSCGAAAWANGKLVVGNGADNIAFYNQGYVDGFNKAVDAASISYVYHQHAGTAYVNGGCVYAWHEHTGDCPNHGGARCTGSVQCTSHGLYTNEHGQAMCRITCSNGHAFVAEHVTDHCVSQETIYDCGNNPLNQWRYNCGKTTSTIESATLTFN